MRVIINLSTEPFRRDRAKLLATAICSLALLALLVAQTWLILGARGRASESRERVARLNAELAEMHNGQAAADTTIQQPLNAEVLERSVLLNSLIQRKAISWARLLDDIGGVLPNNVRMIQIRLPQVNIRNEVTLDMEVGASDELQAVEFTNRLAASPLFGPATLLRSDPPSQNEPLYRYRLTVSYAQKL